MATRSFRVTIRNDTDQAWHLQMAHLLRGDWADRPPDAVPPRGRAVFLAVSGDPAGGVAGVVRYTGSETISIRFTNPSAGANEFGASSTAPRSAYDLLWGDPGGDEARVTLEIRRRRPRWGAQYAVVPARSAVPGGLPGLAAIAPSADDLHLLWVGTDGGIGSRHYNGAWGPPVQVVPAGTAAGGVAAASRYAEHADLFFADADGGIGARSWDDRAQRWNRPARLVPAGSVGPGGGLAAVSRSPEHLDVFWAGADGGVGIRSWHGGWGPPTPLVPAGSVARGGGLAAVSRFPGHLDLFWVCADGGVGVKSWHGVWGVPRHLLPAGSAAGGLAAVSRHREHLDLFWVGTDGGIGLRPWAGAWGQPAPIVAERSTLGGGLAAASRFPEHVDLYWVGWDGGVHARSWHL